MFFFLRIFFFLLSSTLILAYAFYKLKDLSPRNIRSRFFLSKKGLLSILLLFSLVGGWQILYFIYPELLGKFILFDAFIWTGALTFGWIVSFLAFSLIWDGFRLGGFIFSKKTLSPLLERRRFLVQASITGISTLFTGIGTYTARHVLEVKKISIPILDLPSALQGLQIAQISDLHVGLTIRRSYVEKVVEATLALKPDLIVLTGDMVDGDPMTLTEDLEPLKKLNSGAPLGVYFILGNHEYYWGGERWIHKMQELGFTLLLNEHQILKWKGAEFLLGGVTDAQAHRFLAHHQSSPELAMKVCHKTPHPQDSLSYPLRILLAHRPESYEKATQAGFQLMLSGHTHGGQFFPINFIIPFFHRYYKGLNRHENLWVYVNTGTGYWAAPHRLAVPPEITLLTVDQETR